MQVVEFKNVFHIKPDFGRFKDYQVEKIKSICEVIEWSTNIITGGYIASPTIVGKTLLEKKDLEYVNKPIEFFRDTTKIIWRKYVPVAKFNWEKKSWVVPISYINEVYEIGKKCRASHVQIKDDLPEQVDTIPELPELTIDIPLKKGEMRHYQKQGVARGLQLKKFINGDMPGLGKAQPLYSEISTPNGFIEMGKIKVGDEIFAKNGEIQIVTGVFPQGNNEVYVVEFTDGTSVNCDINHLWSVRDGNRRRRGLGWTVKSLKEIIDSGLHYKINEKRQKSGRKPDLKWEVPICEPVQYEAKNYNIHPYILGVMIGDGYLKGSCPQISIPDTEIEIANRISELLPKNLKLKVNRNPACPQYHITQTNTTSKNPFTEELERLGLNVLGGEKFIPLEYLHGSIEQRIELLKGLMDSDGSSCKKNRLSYFSKSLKLILDVCSLVQSLGGTAKIHHYDRNKEGKGIEYYVNINIGFCPFYLERKVKNYQITKSNYVSRYIKKITFKGIEETQCISVSSDDKLYLTNDYVVTHNTLQSIATVVGAEIAGEVTFPVLVICPSALKINWQREFEMWTDKKAIVLNDKIKTSWQVYHEIGEADVFIINPESLRKFFVKKYPKDLKTAADIEMDPRIDLFKSVIIDEIHKQKNPSSQRSKITLRITRGKNYVIGLTGTPVVNKPIDLFAQLAIIGRLSRFGGPQGFKNRYCEGGSGASNLKELNFLLNKNCFFRREKHEVLKDLPDKIRQTITVPISTREEYVLAENNFKTFLQNNDFTDAEIRKKLRSEVIVKITMLLQLSAKGKIEAAQEYIDEVIESGEKIVIFCRHKIVVDELCKIYPNAVRVTGSENESQKQASVDAFQNNPKTNIIIGSHKAAGVGLTLTASSEVLFLELPWHFADLEQCEDRCHRIGQKSSVRSTSLLGENTIDKWLYDLIMEKKQIADTVTGADDVVPTSTMDSIMNAFKK